MNLPLFYEASINAQGNILQLDDDTSRHCIQVLRMKVGEHLQITDGRGNLITAQLTLEHKKAAKAKVTAREIFPANPNPKTIAISLVKNTSRLEWFLEKATEIGINYIAPLICTRTEKQHFRFDRMQNILVSAMIQSRQVWLPVMSEPQSFEEVIHQVQAGQHFIAHCVETDKQSLSGIVNKNQSAVVLIGPEGDFTPAEIESALKAGYVAVTLGDTRLRTETAGLVAAVSLAI